MEHEEKRNTEARKHNLTEEFKMAKNVVKEVSKKGNTARLMIKGTSAAVMNAIRRSIMNEVPVFAIEDIQMYENSGVMYDEFLSHRIGLLPISTDLKTYKLGDKVKLSLEAKGPGTIYSSSIKSADPKVEVVSKTVPLTKLGQNQNLKMEMDAVLGTGKEHAKWQPGLASYRMLPELVVHKERENWKKVIESCPKNVLDVKAKKLVLTDPVGCNLCGACMEECKDGEIEIIPDETSYIVTIETFGGLSNSEIVEKAVDRLQEKTKAFAEAVKALEAE